MTAPLVSEEWVAQTYFDMQTYSNMTDRAGLKLKFGERFRVYSTTTQGVTNSVSFTSSYVMTEFFADGFANSMSQLWSDALVFVDHGLRLYHVSCCQMTYRLFLRLGLSP